MTKSLLPTKRTLLYTILSTSEVNFLIWHVYFKGMRKKITQWQVQAVKLKATAAPVDLPGLIVAVAAAAAVVLSVAIAVLGPITVVLPASTSPMLPLPIAASKIAVSLLLSPVAVLVTNQMLAAPSIVHASK
jgi:hypothetical protein